MRITTETLEELDACQTQIDQFAAEWPNGAEVNVPNVIRAQDMDLNLAWLAKHLLAPDTYEDYSNALEAPWAAYVCAVNTAKVRRSQELAPHFHERNAATNATGCTFKENKAARDKFHDAKVAAGAAYEKTVDAAKAVYYTRAAALFVEAIAKI